MFDLLEATSSYVSQLTSCAHRIWGSTRSQSRGTSRPRSDFSPAANLGQVTATSSSPVGPPHTPVTPWDGRVGGHRRGLRDRNRQDLATGVDTRTSDIYTSRTTGASSEAQRRRFRPPRIDRTCSPRHGAISRNDDDDDGGDGFGRREDPRSRATVRPPCDPSATHRPRAEAASRSPRRPA